MDETSIYCASAVCNMWHEMVMEKGTGWLIAAKKYVSLWQEQREDVVRDVRIMSRWLYGCPFCFRWLMRGALAEAYAHRGILIFIVKG